MLICASQYNDGWCFPRGYALCVVDVFGMKLLDDGTYAWQLQNVRPVLPFKVKGKLHLYDVDDSLIQMVERNSDEFLYDWWQYDLKIITAPKRK